MGGRDWFKRGSDSDVLPRIHSAHAIVQRNNMRVDEEASRKYDL